MTLFQWLWQEVSQPNRSMVQSSVYSHTNTIQNLQDDLASRIYEDYQAYRSLVTRVFDSSQPRIEEQEQLLVNMNGELIQDVEMVKRQKNLGGITESRAERLDIESRIQEMDTYLIHFRRDYIALQSKNLTYSQFCKIHGSNFLIILEHVLERLPPSMNASVHSANPLVVDQVQSQHFDESQYDVLNQDLSEGLKHEIIPFSKKKPEIQGRDSSRYQLEIDRPQPVVNQEGPSINFAYSNQPLQQPVQVPVLRMPEMRESSHQNTQILSKEVQHKQEPLRLESQDEQEFQQIQKPYPHSIKKRPTFNQFNATNIANQKKPDQSLFIAKYKVEEIHKNLKNENGFLSEKIMMLEKELEIIKHRQRQGEMQQKQMKEDQIKHQKLASFVAPNFKQRNLEMAVDDYYVIRKMDRTALTNWKMLCLLSKCMVYQNQDILIGQEKEVILDSLGNPGVRITMFFKNKNPSKRLGFFLEVYAGPQRIIFSNRSKGLEINSNSKRIEFFEIQAYEIEQKKLEYNIRVQDMRDIWLKAPITQIDLIKTLKVPRSVFGQNWNQNLNKGGFVLLKMKPGTLDGEVCKGIDELNYFFKDLMRLRVKDESTQRGEQSGLMVQLEKCYTNPLIRLEILNGILKIDCLIDRDYEREGAKILKSIHLLLCIQG